MLVNNIFSASALTIANVAAGGAIGTAAATVDIGSSFHINQTTAGQTLKLPDPTTSFVGQLAFVANTGTASFMMSAVTVSGGFGMILQWTGTAWVPIADITSAGVKKFYQLSTFVANTGLVITHNLALATPKAVQFEFRDTNGQSVDLCITAYAANSVTVLSNIAQASVDTTIIG